MINQFRKYDDVERLGKDEVEGILNGTVYIFEKIDGANVSLYWDNENGVVICSRNNIIYSDRFGGNFRGIVEYVKANPNIEQMLKATPNSIFYGEWLVKHTITYPIEFSNKIWFFDIYSRDLNRYLNWEVSKLTFRDFSINHINVKDILENPTIEKLQDYMKDNQFKGEPQQEGIVIKNYNFVNKFGRQQWTKIVNEQFKEVKRETKDKEVIEIKLAERYVTLARVEKIMNKVVDEKTNINFLTDLTIDGKLNKPHYKLSEKDTSQVLGRVWNDIVQEEIWQILKDEKEPTINFKEFKKECYNISRSIFFAKLGEY